MIAPQGHLEDRIWDMKPDPADRITRGNHTAQEGTVWYFNPLADRDPKKDRPWD